LRFAAALLAVIALVLPATADTWTVEKDGSGDFTVIQDAIDAAAEGDSILVGPGRFSEFRPASSTIDGIEFQAIAWVTTPNVTLLGAGAEFTTLGADSVVSEVDGLFATAIHLDGGSAGTAVRGFRIENTAGCVRIRDRVEVTDCEMFNPTNSHAIIMWEGDDVFISDVQFEVDSGIITGSPLGRRAVIENCTFTGIPDNDFGIVIGNGATDAEIRGCTFDGMDTAIQFSLGGTGVVENCSMQAVGFAAIDLSSGAAVMRGCTIEEGARVPIRVGAGVLEIYDSIIGGGTTTTIFSANSMTVRNSHILNSGALSVLSSGSLPLRVMDLVGNWWGTSDAATIASWIEDENGNVTYEPFLPGPVPTEVKSMGGMKALFDSLQGDSPD